MKKRLKGFTLIECLIALLILAVSSLLLVQAYTQLVRATRENYTMYNSIGRQMADAENPSYGEGKATDVQSKKIDEVKTITFSVKYPDNSTASGRTISEEVYVYVVSPYDMTGGQLPTGADQGSGSAAANAPDGTDTRFLYFHS
ncbi:MAG: prepilin-type N-terminal cleavage/methylation domain-containing protein [Oscillospiraceae bacterium]|nr:prepilin-type N-terminal cleavage/methylation domain-containing protein [Oscillospiraceae bacterium]